MARAPHARADQAAFLEAKYGRHRGGIRDGDWKLILPAPRRGEIELYDLATDPGETINVAAERADVVKRLSAMLETWTGSLPNEYFEAGAD